MNSTYQEQFRPAVQNGRVQRCKIVPISGRERVRPGGSKGPTPAAAQVRQSDGVKLYSSKTLLAALIFKFIRNATRQDIGRQGIVAAPLGRRRVHTSPRKVACGRDASGGDRTAQRIPRPISEPHLCAVRGDRCTGSQRGACARQRNGHRCGCAVAVQADGLQGRMRGGAPAY
jgi:hypothetical protein